MNTVASLERELRDRTHAEVYFDDGNRALYATDASNYRQVPIGVVIPRDVDDIVAAMAVCHAHRVPVLARGGGTSLAGQCCNVAVVIDTSRHCNRILEIDAESRTALVEPGCVLDTLRQAVEQHGLTFGPDPSTHDHNTLGGMIGNNSCGVHSVMAGRTADNVVALEILTYDGLRMWVGETSPAELAQTLQQGGRRAAIYLGLVAIRDEHADGIRERYPDIPRRVSGYNLAQLLPEKNFNVARALVGSEGTCVFVLRARLRLVPNPAERSLVVLGFDSIYDAADAVPGVLLHKPIGLEGFDQRLVDFMRKKDLHPEELDLVPEGAGWLMAEFGGSDRQEACERARHLIDAMEGQEKLCSAVLFDTTEKAHKLWEVRESGLGATARVPGERNTFPGWEDSSVPPQRLGSYMRGLRRLLQDFGYGGSMYGHFGDGCLHIRIDFDLQTEQGIAHWRQFMSAAADLVLEHGGSLSGEHGDGQARAELLHKMFGEALMRAMRDFKRLWDPDGKMNPGKVIDPDAMDENLRLRPGLRHAQIEPVFSYPQDNGDLTHAVLRCVGVGKCRRAGGGTMCPSFQATREEQHSTRGRAHLLYEMLRGMSNEDAVLHAGWRSKAVHESLDLCLACKGCKSECPINVDIAKYKAEFMHRYYAGRLRPRAAYSMGLIYWWARMGSYAPGLVNLALRTPILKQGLQWAGGIARQRNLPRLAHQTYTSEVKRTVSIENADVLLWPDTFSNHFRPQSLRAADEVLQSFGLRVAVPQRIACCGRPLYADGMLDLARRQVLHLLDVLQPAISRGLPIIGIEPSCVASFRDEIPELLPRDERARYLGENTFTFGEFLELRGFEPPSLDRPALVHMHCNHRAVMGVKAELAILDTVLPEFSIPEPGCCGMAGPFGFDAMKYDVSMRIAERALLPAVRACRNDILIVADGFSCREQILQATGRNALHLAEVVRMAQTLN